MTFTLPYPPSTNTAYAVRNGRKIKTTKAREYAYDVMRNVADTVRFDLRAIRPTSDDRLALHILVHAPDARRRDLMNTEKLAVDAICTQLNIDDSQIDRVTLERAPIDRENPRLTVTIEAIA